MRMGDILFVGWWSFLFRNSDLVMIFAERDIMRSQNRIVLKYFRKSFFGEVYG